MTIGGPVTRDGAREEARRELSRAIYHGDGPSWWDRLIHWAADRLTDMLDWFYPDDGQGGGSSRGLGVLALVLVIVVAVIAVRWWLGPVRRTARTRQSSPDDLSSTLSAAELRMEAERHAAQGNHTLAVRSRIRAIVRMLEDKGVLEPRPGRTAGELVADVAATLTPAGHLAPPAGDAAPADGPLAALAAAVEVFSETWYGGRPAAQSGYQVVVDADAALSRLRSLAGGQDESAVSHMVPA
jgi:hypothetical protein